VEARQELETARDIRAQLANGGNARALADLHITQANIAYLEGTIKEIAQDFRGAAFDFLDAARKNPRAEDERQDEMSLREATFHKLAGVNYLKAGRQADGRHQLDTACKIANDAVNKSANRELFSTICSEVESLLNGHSQ
jgi:hypothetical protein